VSTKVITVIGARPQFIKAAMVSRAIAALNASGDGTRIEERIVHTGQHYDPAMSDVFFQALKIPSPAYHLGIGSGGHGAQTGRMLEALEPVLEKEKPDVVLVYGDTNSTLAGALCAAKLHIPVAHVEAGLRSFNRRMPEEINRVMTDHLSSLLFAPTEAAVRNLKAEGIREGVIRTGDVMYDAVLFFREKVGQLAAGVLERFGVKPGNYAFATVHRAENTDDPERWAEIIQGLTAVARSGLPVVWPVHPRTRERLDGFDVPGLHLLDPLPYFETQALLMHARVALTDSGGLQKEAAFHKVPCVTLRDETEWVELIEHGVNQSAGANARQIVTLALAARWPSAEFPREMYGDGGTSQIIVSRLRSYVPC